ncbi:MAG: HAD family phosphatase [Chloroflexi bacterium]|nr:HAD family phosphatase [Chloroflexota bacterium]
MKLNGAQAVIFDLDGLIVDSEPLHQESFNILLARHGIAYRIAEEEYGRVFVGVPVRENCEWLIANLGLKISAEQAIVEREAAFLELISNPRNLVVMPGAREIIERLREKDIPLALATGASRAEAETMLRGIGMTGHFRAVVTGSDVARGKPAPDIYLRALERMGFAGENCLALEDSASGIAAAKSAGLRVIAVPNRYTRHQDLSGADEKVESLEEMINLM